MVSYLPEDPTITARIPLGRAGRVEELMNLVLYLSSEVSEYISG
jgi:NAD(P)-dependent dehydrogenase (short-subunit alcohol dehydrogenase family)